MHRSWTKTGFCVLLGVVVGMWVSDRLPEKAVWAGANSTINQEYCMAVGEGPRGQNDLVWLLDYEGARLHCFTLDQRGNMGLLGGLDLIDAFEIADPSKKLHFMMVTGSFNVGSVDLLYLAETTTGQILSISPPSIQGKTKVPPGVVTRLPFREQQ